MSLTKTTSEIFQTGYVRQPDGSYSRPKGKTMAGCDCESLSGTMHRTDCKVAFEANQGAIKAIKAIKAKKPRMNQVERRFYEILKARYPSAVITPQFRLRVSAWDSPVLCFYTVDFLISESALASDPSVPLSGYWKHTLYETKDSRRKGHSDELTRPKTVRLNNPWINAVVLAVWSGSEWKERLIA